MLARPTAGITPEGFLFIYYLFILANKQVMGNELTRVWLSMLWALGGHRWMRLTHFGASKSEALFPGARNWQGGFAIYLC